MPVARPQHAHRLARLVVPQPDGQVPRAADQHVAPSGEARDVVVVRGREDAEESDPVPRVFLTRVPHLEVASDEAADDEAFRAGQRRHHPADKVPLRLLEEVPGCEKKLGLNVNVDTQCLTRKG